MLLLLGNLCRAVFSLESAAIFSTPPFVLLSAQLLLNNNLKSADGGLDPPMTQAHTITPPPPYLRPKADNLMSSVQRTLSQMSRPVLQPNRVMALTFDLRRLRKISYLIKSGGGGEAELPAWKQFWVLKSFNEV